MELNTVSDMIQLVVLAPLWGFAAMLVTLGGFTGALAAVGAIYWFVDKVEGWTKK